MGMKRNRARLADAQADQAPVLVDRAIEGAASIEGYVVALGDAWVVLHVVSGLRLSGWTALRLDTIQRVRRARHPTLLDRAMDFWGEHSHAPGVDPSSTQSVLTTAGEVYPLIVVHLEDDRPGLAYTGQVVRAGRRRLRLRHLTEAAEWAPQVVDERLDLRDITRVDVGTDATRVLWALAAEPPGQ